jgi:hypothetical protein
MARKTIRWVLGIYHPAFIDSLRIRGWPGKKAALKYLDRIIVIYGEPIVEGRGVARMVTEKQP